MKSIPATKEIYLMSIGLLMQRAAANELLMLNAFRLLSKTNQDTARTIFYTFDSFNGRKTLLDKISALNGDEEDIKLVKEITKAVEKSNKQRIQVAHSINFHDDPELSSPIKTINPKTGGEPKLVTNEFLSDLLMKSFEAIAEGRQAIEQLFQKHGEPLERLIV